MKFLKFLLLFLLCGLAAAEITDPNVDRSMSGWSQCYYPACNPGGLNPPASVEQKVITGGQLSLENTAMLLSQTSPAGGNSNVLFTFKASPCDACTSVVADFWVYPTTGIAELEYDSFQFSESQSIEYMWGTQCVTGSVWDVWNQSTGHWIPTNLPCNVIFNTWNHIVIRTHRVNGDPGTCAGFPCMYWDSISVNGQTEVPKPNVEPSGPLPTGWSSTTGFQIQLDVATPDTTVSEYLSVANFTAAIAKGT